MCFAHQSIEQSLRRTNVHLKSGSKAKMFYPDLSAAHATNSLNSSQASKLKSRRNARKPKLTGKALLLGLEEPAIGTLICAARWIQLGALVTSLVASRETTVKLVWLAVSIPECLPTSMTTQTRYEKSRKASLTSQIHPYLAMVLKKVGSLANSSELWRSYHCTRKAGKDWTKCWIEARDCAV